MPPSAESLGCDGKKKSNDATQIPTLRLAHPTHTHDQKTSGIFITDGRSSGAETLDRLVHINVRFDNH